MESLSFCKSNGQAQSGHDVGCERKGWFWRTLGLLVSLSRGRTRLDLLLECLLEQRGGWSWVRKTSLKLRRKQLAGAVAQARDKGTSQS